LNLTIAVIINDVASVNIDGATISEALTAADGESVEMLELQNGCVCCGPQAGELASSIKSLVALGHERGLPFDHVVVEMSGVADPHVVKTNLRLGGIHVSRVVTLVDTPAFAEQWMTIDVMEQRAGLATGEEASARQEATAAALATPADLEADECAAKRRVVSLLVAQIEAADVIVLNKIDMSTEDEVVAAAGLCRALARADAGQFTGEEVREADATVVRASFGACDVADLLPRLVDSGTDHACPSLNQHVHGHEHGQASASPTTTAPTPVDTTVDGLGIDSFVFTAADRPFDDARLTHLIERWPLPSKESASFDLAAFGQPKPAEPLPGADGCAWEAVLRSKGNIWLRSRHRIRPRPPGRPPRVLWHTRRVCWTGVA